MPDPIVSSSVNASHDFEAHVSSDETEVNMCLAAPEPETSSLPPKPHVVLEPVLIEGEASGRQLVESHYTQRTPSSCGNEKDAAVYGCAAATVAVTAFAVSLPTGVGAVFTAGAAAVAADNCRRLINVYDDCLALGFARYEAAVRCEARGGTPASGVEKHEILCHLPVEP